MTFQTNKRVTILYSTPILEVEFNTPQHNLGHFRGSLHSQSLDGYWQKTVLESTQTKYNSKKLALYGTAKDEYKKSVQLKFRHHLGVS